MIMVTILKSYGFKDDLLELMTYTKCTNKTTCIMKKLYPILFSEWVSILSNKVDQMIERALLYIFLTKR